MTWILEPPRASTRSYLPARHSPEPQLRRLPAILCCGRRVREREREREREDSETRVEGRIEQLQITDEAWGQREGGEENNTKVDWVSWMTLYYRVCFWCMWTKSDRTHLISTPFSVSKSKHNYSWNRLFVRIVIAVKLAFAETVDIRRERYGEKGIWQYRRTAFY